MAFLDDVSDYIVANTSLEKNVDFFGGEMPDTPNACTAIFQYPGNPPSKLGGNRSPGLQVRTRAASYVAALVLIENVFAILDPIGDEFKDDAPEGVAINGTDYLSFITQGEPLPIGKDSSGRSELTQNYIVTYPQD